MKIGVSSYSFRKYILQTKCDYFKICDIAKGKLNTAQLVRHTTSVWTA